MVDLRQARSTDGWLIFAAVVMFIVGFHNLIYGIASLRDYVVVVDNLSSSSNGNGVIYAGTTFWGWLWIAVGIVEMCIAFAIAAGNELARWVGIIIAALNAIGQLAFLAAFPVWSVVIIALDILVIYALATYPSRVSTGGAVQPYPGDRPGLARGSAEQVRSGAYAGSSSGAGPRTRGGAVATGDGDRAAGDSGGAARNSGSGGDFFQPTTAGPGTRSGAGTSEHLGAERPDTGYRNVQGDVGHRGGEEPPTRTDDLDR
ncbi:hypothetical protein ACG83_34350 [Frankia sp. R43]|uniref:DUF7144 family membrane protein n=1 Tax=Frankia sp. R43 TaxID=269536 RepID=UPI0006CA4EE5|nr:hypothetical protein [Frankia sp. R43]KPM51236.1 hypothetical protein ACG83_34350 [Frankia sp. R43]